MVVVVVVMVVVRTTHVALRVGHGGAVGRANERAEVSRRRVLVRGQSKEGSGRLLFSSNTAS